MKLIDIKKLLSNVIEVNQLLNQTNRVKLAASEQLAPVLTKLAEVHDKNLVSDVAKSIAKELERHNRKV